MRHRLRGGLPRPTARVDRRTVWAYRRALEGLLCRVGVDQAALPAGSDDLLRDYGTTALERDRLTRDLEDARRRDDGAAARDARRDLFNAGNRLSSLERRLADLVARDQKPAAQVDPMAALHERLAQLAAGRGQTGAPPGAEAQRARADGTHITQAAEDKPAIRGARPEE